MAKLFVICGHGAGDSGACGNGYTEAERVRALGKRIKDFGGSSVMLGDVNRNYYADNGISTLGISKDYQIIELHMDSSVSSSAKGAHVIIKAGLKADAYDNALANFLGGIFPGRSIKLVGRSNLANPKRAAAKGYGYRLCECGFISNANDVNIFNTRMDEIAKGILSCFGIGSNGSVPATSPAPSAPTTSTDSSGDIAVDGYWGRNTTKLAQKVFGTVIDGVVSNQYITYKGQNPGLDSGWEWEANPGKNGSLLIKAIQKWVGVKQDGFIGPVTIKAMQRKLGCSVCDGHFSNHSPAIKAFQNYLNSKN